MNTTHKVSLDVRPDPLLSLGRLSTRCVRCYERVLHSLAAVKARVERQFGRAMAGYEQLLKAAVNEAEALAWQTPYPHLFFPALAEEKATKAQQWAAGQRALRDRLSARLRQR